MTTPDAPSIQVIAVRGDDGTWTLTCPLIIGEIEARPLRAAIHMMKAKIAPIIGWSASPGAFTKIPITIEYPQFAEGLAHWKARRENAGAASLQERAAADSLVGTFLANGMTQDDTALIMGVTQQRVSQVKHEIGNAL